MKTQLLEILGFCAVVAGIAMIYIPAALIVGGIVIVTAAFVFDSDPEDKPESDTK